MMSRRKNITLNKEVLIQRWQHQLINRTHINFHEFTHLLRQHLLLETFFCFFDRDSSGLLSESEWIGSIYKVTEISNRTKSIRTLEPFIRAFRHVSHGYDSICIDDFLILFEDTSFIRDFALLFLDEKGSMNINEFTDLLRSVSNLKTDTKWLSWLAYQFHMAVSSKHRNAHTNNTNKDDFMDLETFKTSFYFKVSELADCLFNYLDTDKTGQLTLENFIRNLEFIVEANDTEKVEFLFKIFDRDGDGSIDFDEMKLLLRCFLEESPSLDMEETLAELTATLFQETDLDQSGDISFEELTNAFRQNEHLFKVLSLSTSSWIRPKPSTISKYHKRSTTIRAWLRNNIDLIFFWSLYSFICICICIDVLRFYVGQQRAHFFIVIARLNGGMLNFNCALILVLMLRKHITWLRSKGGSILLPLDHHIDIHKSIGIIIMIETALHTVAHLAYLAYVFYICSLTEDIGFPCNTEIRSDRNMNFNSSLIHPDLLKKRYRYDSIQNRCVSFGYIGCGGNWNHFYTANLCTLRCKPYHDTYYHYADAIFTAKLGLGYITGVVELILGALIYIMCLPFVRKSGHFQLFYWCHMLTLPWLVIMILHAPNFWKWLLLPGVLYIIEKLLRYRKSRSNKHGETYIMEAILLPSQVIHLVINKPRKFTYKPGDYIYINIPAVANFEWHPFSISSAPEHKDSLWLHVRANGHWTRRVYELFRKKLKQEHGGIVNDFNDIRLRSSMRSRMSKSYIEELRGVQKRKFDLNNNQQQQQQSNRSSNSSSIQMKTTSISFPTNKQQTNTICLSCQSTINLHDIELNPIDKQEYSTKQTILIEPKKLEDLTVEDIETDTEHSKPKTILKSAIKTTNRLTVPIVEHSRIHVPNQTTFYEEQQQIEFTETRPSDALGYLRMYKNQNRIQFNSLQFNDREDLQVLIDGPYGAPSQHIFQAEHAVLIAAGIGITPFASILQSIMCRYRNSRHKCPNCDFIWDNPETEEICLKKVDFIWVTREQRSLEWFISLLAQMEIEQQRLRQNSDKGPLLEVHLYVTSAQSSADLKALNVYLSLDLIGQENAANCQAIDGIRQRTKHGRPDWEQVFGELLCQKKGKISVFYCGPPALSAELTTKCRQYGFAYRKELF